MTLQNMTETTYETKRVLMRAENRDELLLSGEDTPDSVTVAERSLTYYGPKLWVEGNDSGDLYVLTVPGPNSEAVLWDTAMAEKLAEVELRFGDDIPQYDICLHCNEPLRGATHRRRAAVGGCDT